MEIIRKKISLEKSRSRVQGSLPYIPFDEPINDSNIKLSGGTDGNWSNFPYDICSMSGETYKFYFSSATGDIIWSGNTENVYELNEEGKYITTKIGRIRAQEITRRYNTILNILRGGIKVKQLIEHNCDNGSKDFANTSAYTRDDELEQFIYDYVPYPESAFMFNDKTYIMVAEVEEYDEYANIISDFETYEKFGGIDFVKAVDSINGRLYIPKMPNCDIPVFIPISDIKETYEEMDKMSKSEDCCIKKKWELKGGSAYTNFLKEHLEDTNNFEGDVLIPYIDTSILFTQDYNDLGVLTDVEIDYDEEEDTPYYADYTYTGGLAYDISAVTGVWVEDASGMTEVQFSGMVLTSAAFQSDSAVSIHMNSALDSLRENDYVQGFDGTLPGIFASTEEFFNCYYYTGKTTYIYSTVTMYTKYDYGEAVLEPDVFSENETKVRLSGYTSETIKTPVQIFTPLLQQSGIYEPIKSLSSSASSACPCFIIITSAFTTSSITETAKIGKEGDDAYSAFFATTYEYECSWWEPVKYTGKASSLNVEDYTAITTFELLKGFKISPSEQKLCLVTYINGCYEPLVVPYKVNNPKNYYKIDGNNYIGDFVTSIKKSGDSITIDYVLGGKFTSGSSFNWITGTGIVCTETYPYSKCEAKEITMDNVDKVKLYYEKIHYDETKQYIYNDDLKLGRYGNIATISSYTLGDVWKEDCGESEVINAPTFKDDYYMGISFKYKSDINVEINRGNAAAFEKHFKLSECNTFEDLEYYGNNFFGTE